MPADPSQPDSAIEERGWMAMVRALECPIEDYQDQNDVDELHEILAGLPEVRGGRPDQLLRTTGKTDRSTW